jgi:hypothetical protein
MISASTYLVCKLETYDKEYRTNILVASLLESSCNYLDIHVDNLRTKTYKSLYIDMLPLELK